MDSCVVPHRSTNRAVLWLTAQIGRDAVLSESYGRRHSSYPYACFMRSIIIIFFFFFSLGGRRPPSPPEAPLRRRGGAVPPSKSKGKDQAKAVKASFLVRQVESTGPKVDGKKRIKKKIEETSNRSRTNL